MLAIFYFLYIIIRCWLDPTLAPVAKVEKAPLPVNELFVLLAQSLLPPFALIALVLGSIIFGWATPTEAAGVGAAGAIALSFFTFKPETISKASSRAVGEPGMNVSSAKSFREFLSSALYQTTTTNAMLFAIFIGSTIFAYTFRSLGGDDLIIGFVDHLGLGSWALLLMIMLVVFLLGFFLDWIEITMIVLPIFAPVIADFDFGAHVDPASTIYWFAILMALNLQTSFLTPPFGFSLFYMKAAAGDNIELKQIYRGAVPFVIIQIIGLGLVMAFPEIALWLPNQLAN